MRKVRRHPPRWLPDWRDPGAYPAPGAPISEWRWQFLRRRGDYQDDFAALPLDQAHQIRQSRDRGKWWLMKRATGNQSRKYGLQYLLDPACPHPLAQMNDGPFFPSMDADVGIDHRLPELEGAGVVLVAVDLRRSIKDQLKLIAPDLAAEAKRRGFGNTKDKRENWPRHLRVLDGLAAGATLAEIAGALDTDYATAEKWPRDAEHAQGVLTSPTRR